VIFTISGKHIEVPEALKDYAKNKTSKLLRYYDSVNQIDVIIEKDGGKTAVEIIARAEHSKVFIAKESAEDIHKCVDVVVHKLERQLTKAKTKERNNKHISEPG